MLPKPEPKRPYAPNSGEGWTGAFGPEFILKAGEIGQGRRVAFVDFTTRTGEEPGAHTHPTEDEIFYVIHGDITFICGEETYDLNDGGFMFLPRGIKHGPRSAATATCPCSSSRRLRTMRRLAAGRASSATASAAGRHRGPWRRYYFRRRLCGGDGNG